MDDLTEKSHSYFGDPDIADIQNRDMEENVVKRSNANSVNFRPLNNDSIDDRNYYSG